MLSIETCLVNVNSMSRPLKNEFTIGAGIDFMDMFPKINQSHFFMIYTKIVQGKSGYFIKILKRVIPGFASPFSPSDLSSA